MEPENHPFEMENHLNQTSIFGFHVSFRECMPWHSKDQQFQGTIFFNGQADFQGMGMGGGSSQVSDYRKWLVEGVTIPPLFFLD